MDPQQQFCLKWNSFGSNLATAFGNLFKSESLADVTLFCEGVIFKAHKLILAACSKHFQDLFEGTPSSPSVIVILDGTSSANMSALLEFMYKGEVHVSQEHLSSFLKAAECLQVKGLSIEHEKLAMVQGQQQQLHHQQQSSNHTLQQLHSRSSPPVSPRDSPTSRSKRINGGSGSPETSPVPGSTGDQPSSCYPPVLSPYLHHPAHHYRAAYECSPHAPHAPPPPRGGGGPMPSASALAAAAAAASHPYPTAADCPIAAARKRHHRSPSEQSQQDMQRASVLREPPKSPHSAYPSSSYRGGAGSSPERSPQQLSAATPAIASYDRERERCGTSTTPTTSSTAAVATADCNSVGGGNASPLRDKSPASDPSCPEDLRIKMEVSSDMSPSGGRGGEGGGGGGGTGAAAGGDNDYHTSSSNNTLLYKEKNAAEKDILSSPVPPPHPPMNLWDATSVAKSIKAATPTDGKKLKCPFCERLYGYETNLRAHIRQRHQGIRVPCPFCSRTFTRNNTVRRHIAREHKTELNVKAYAHANHTQ